MEVNSSEGGGELGLGFPVWIAARRRFKPDDPFFAAGNIERELIAKHVALDLTEDERFQLQKMEDADSTFNCPIVGCGAHLSCLEDFEDHYRARHTASCSVCSRIYPTSRLLSIHISEAHDSFFQAKVARGFPMYECLVEGCGMKLKSYRSRQQHLMDKHRFPTSFEFFKKARSSKRHRQKHQSKKAGGHWKEARDTDMEVDENTTLRSSQKYRPRQAGQKAEEEGMEIEGKMDELVSAVSKLSASDSTPSTVSFGHRHARGFSFLPRAVRQNAKQVSQPESKV